MAIRLVQVGMGNWGRNWATNVIQRSEDVALVACVDLDAELLVQTQQLLSIPAERCFQTLKSALASVEAEAVLITGSLPAHVPTALEALHAGKHVLLEKPFTPTLAEAQQVVEMAAKRNRVLMISQNYRFFPAVQTVTALIREGKLGSIGSVTVDFRRYKNSSEAADHHSGLESSLERVRRSGCRCGHHHLRSGSSGELSWKLGKSRPEDQLERR